MIPPQAKKVFEGILFDVYQWEQELFDGTTTTFEKLKRLDIATVIPVLPNGKILMTLDEQPAREPIITFPGGKSEAGEDIQESARRELLEETGYAAKELLLWKTSEPSSKIEWHVHYFIARECEKVAEHDLDSGEKITPMEVSLDEMLAYTDDPRFKNTGLALELMRIRYNSKLRTDFEQLLYGPYIL